jgi:hypothetical protein
MELDLAVAAVLNDHGVLELERVLLHETAEGFGDLLSLVYVVVRDCHEI